MTTRNLTPEGRYPGVLRTVQFADAKTGTTQAVLGFEFTDESGQPTNQFMPYFGALTDAAIDFTVEALRNCGWEGDDLSELPALVESGALSSPVQLVVVHEEYNGEWRAKIKFVNRAGGGKLRLERELDDAGLKSFAQRMKSRVRAAGRDRVPRSSGNGHASSPKPGMPPQRDTPPPNDDDIPF